MGSVATATDPGGVTAVRTLLLIDLVDSTRWLERLGDRRAAEVLQHHDRLARDLLARHAGREIDKTDGFLLLFERPAEAVRYALEYHRSLQGLSRHEEIPLQARAAVHLGEVLLRENSAEDVALGAKPLEVEGLAKPTTARLLSLARGRQTLLSRSAFDLARQGVDRSGEQAAGLRWLAHGAYRFQGVSETVEVFEVGEEDLAPLEAPTDSLKARRVVAAEDELTLGWRPAAGQSIPRRPSWVLRERLGEGGFGEVWCAEQEATGETRVFKFCYEAARLRALQREVTLFRLLKESLGDRDDIARIVDWSFDEAPYFLEAEYTEGGNLVEWIDEQGGAGRVSLETRLELAAQIADALAAAHSVGVLHKDVKPTNVLIYEDRDGTPRVRLTDFGIGRVTDAAVLAGKGITVFGLTGMVASDAEAMSEGTRLYMAPELLEGKPASMQADVYALGVLLYQLVAGDLTRALGPGWRRDVPDDLLAEDIAALVDRDPARRPANAAEVAQRLRTLPARRAEREEERRARHEAEAARRALERAHRRRKVAAWIAAAALVVLGVVSFLAFQALEARNEAQHRREQAENLIGFMLGELRSQLRDRSQLALLNTIGDEALEYFASVPQASLTSEELSRHSQALYQIGEVRMQEGDLPRALHAFEQSLDLARELVQREPGRSQSLFGASQSHFWVGLVHYRQGDLDAALEHFGAYRDLARELVRRDPDNPQWRQELSYAHSNLADVFERQGRWDEALRTLQDNVRVRRELVRENPDDPDYRLDLAHAYGKLGTNLTQAGRPADALEHHLAELEILRGLVRADPSDHSHLLHLVTSLHHSGNALEDLYEPDEARRYFEEAVAVATELTQRDPDNAEWRRELAVNQVRLARVVTMEGEPETALEHVRAAVALFDGLVAESVTDPEWIWDRAMAHGELGDVLLTLDRPSEAVDRFRTAGESFERIRDEVFRNPTRVERWIGLQTRWVEALQRLARETEAAEVCEDTRRWTSQYGQSPGNELLRTCAVYF